MLRSHLDVLSFAVLILFLKADEFNNLLLSRLLLELTDCVVKVLICTSLILSKALGIFLPERPLALSEREIQLPFRLLE